MLDLKMEEGTISQGKWEVVESGKSKEINSRTSRRKYGPTYILILTEQDMCQTSNLKYCNITNFLLLQVTNFVIFCYNNNREQI